MYGLTLLGTAKSLIHIDPCKTSTIDFTGVFLYMLELCINVLLLA
jgi:hypothetical protein